MWCDCVPQHVHCHLLAVGHWKQHDETISHCLSQNVQCHSLAGGHRKSVMKQSFINVQVTHNLLVMGKDVMRLSSTTCAISLTPYSCSYDLTAFHNMCNVTHKLLVMGTDLWWDCLSQHVQFHWLSVGHSRRCDETAIHKMCNVTHKLMKRCDETAFHKIWASLTPCCSYEHMWWDCLSQNVQCHSQAVGHRKNVIRLPFTKIRNVTYTLLIILKGVVRPFTKCAMSQSHTCCCS